MNNIEIIERLKKIIGAKEDQELARILGLGKTAIANWKRGTGISLYYVVDIAKKYNCDLHWLITGEERKIEIDPISAMLLSGFKGLSDSQKLKAVTYIGNLANNNQEEEHQVQQNSDFTS